MPIITIDRSVPLDVSKLLDAKGFEVRESEVDKRSLEIIELDTSRLRLEWSMVGAFLMLPHRRLEWLQQRGVIRPDGHILEALNKHNMYPEEWKENNPWTGKPLRPLFDGVPLHSTWDDQDFTTYVTHNRLRGSMEIRYVGSWAAPEPSVIILP